MGTELNTWGCGESYCNLICHFFILIGNLLFHGWRWNKKCLGVKAIEERDWEVRMAGKRLRPGCKINTWINKKKKMGTEEMSWQSRAIDSRWPGFDSHHLYRGTQLSSSSSRVSNAISCLLQTPGMPLFHKHTCRQNNCVCVWKYFKVFLKQFRLENHEFLKSKFKNTLGI